VIALRLRGGNDDDPLPSARVMWCRPVPGAPDAHAAGLAWEGEPPLRTRLLLEQVALFDLELGDDGVALVRMHGDFTEMTRFDALAARLVGATTISFDLAAVRYISSAGVRAWCELLAKLAGARLSFRHCSTAFISQAARCRCWPAAPSARSRRRTTARRGATTTSGCSRSARSPGDRLVAPSWRAAARPATSTTCPTATSRSSRCSHAPAGAQPFATLSTCSTTSRRPAPSAASLR
jgi:hypothetical protein